ncbi:uncharacterized membrane protein YoaT (DUF817 family) [Microbacterium resistens]|uniref:Uncharacterized membrane protein YoaT (DUF817 family) n=1 Tax=Microbacterium resistens TaxID=156977 RepID=A0ABU1SE48_9MICO|nr:DUF817 domain-containing protein [Microbacterium resistens]MDR6867895.1 uncharacterized membrane protein YoaT (DUF817 family) [Microbacterium resistens]
MLQPTRLEARIDATARRILAKAPASGVRGFLVECAVFVIKQAWACVFGALLLLAIVLVRGLYPEGLALARNDLLTIIAVLIQVLMLVTRLESGRELWVIMLFHVTGTVMELFKTDMGSWVYDADGILRIGAVPLFSGFMYAAVGSYMVRVHRLFDLGFRRYPPLWATIVLAALIYLNFFTHHWFWDARWVLTALVVLLWLPTVMHARVWRRTLRIPLLLPFAGVALFIWFAENIGTWSGAWLYPDQVDGWQLVSLSKLSSWFLLMIISVVLVTLVSPPVSPPGERLERKRTLVVDRDA